jgi:hypothetical protein
MADEAQVHVSLTEEEKRQIRTEAGKRDLSMSELGRDVLTDWLNERSEE